MGRGAVSPGTKLGLLAFPIPECGKKACTGLGDVESKPSSALYWLCDFEDPLSELGFSTPELTQHVSRQQPREMNKITSAFQI